TKIFSFSLKFTTLHMVFFYRHQSGICKWFIGQFYFTKTIATMLNSNGFAVSFSGDKGILSQTIFYILVKLS
ncbi:TPA: hypothetical protein ACOYS5_001704, partial [Streptococcus pneumoniae]